MDYGLILPSLGDDATREGIDAAGEIAERLGFTDVWTTDHLLVDASAAEDYGTIFEAVTTLAYLAGRTTRVRLGASVVVVPMRNAVVLAKELATIDLLSEGRLEVGLGAGWVAAEYEGMGIPMDRPGIRIERLAEYVELIRAQWAGEPLDIQGAHVRARGFAGRPRPVQTPHPPIMIGGGAPRILRTAGRLADIVSLNFDNSTGKLGSASVASATLERTEEKINWIREGAGERFPEIELEVGAYFVSVNDDPTDAIATMASRFGVTPDELRAHPHALLGSVDSICDTLQERRERLGISYITVAQRHGEEFAPIVARLAGT
jgi:probable F420-dependent oxidoreductase